MNADSGGLDDDDNDHGDQDVDDEDGGGGGELLIKLAMHKQVLLFEVKLPTILAILIIMIL